MSFTFPFSPAHSFVPGPQVINIHSCQWHCRSLPVSTIQVSLHPTTGIIYFIPRDADNIGEFDSMTNTFSVVDISSIISSNHNYNGGVLGPTV